MRLSSLMGDRRWNRAAAPFVLVAGVLAVAACSSGSAQVPEFAAKAQYTEGQGEQTAVLAGGCFWGVDAVFKHVKGVKRVVSGFSGGGSSTAHYELVSTGTTGHAESVEITYDPSQVTYGDLLRVFFSVAHDPTELNYQGPDHGPQYRSVIFYANPLQQTIAIAYIKELDQAHVFAAPIVTQVAPLAGFYAAESYHQNFLARHPDYPYIVFNDLPKLRAL
ncbi:MAG TPA: peptide-methionine (S)-S-oxide reductase MsrA, partial [Terriglobia bacterium]|nr:peptide-methionine (S)-S-oxide reductase MsrA [Terriglobia bacterium]